MTLLRHAKVGMMTIDRWHSFWFDIGARVLLYGHDITDKCRWFDDVTGEAECYVLDNDGRHSVDANGDPETVVWIGHVEVAIP